MKQSRSRKFGLALVAIGISLSHLALARAEQLQASTGTIQKTELNRLMNSCSGAIGDMNCYKDIISGLASGRPASSVPPQRTAMLGRNILIDTYDRSSCEKVQQALDDSRLNFVPSNDIKDQGLDIRSLCEPNLRNANDRYRTITVMEEVSEEYYTPLKLKFLKNTDNNLTNATKNMALLMVGTMGLLWTLPESVTKWNKSDINKDGFVKKYKSHLTHRPVWDKDDPVVNYVGHPVSGAAYYTLARNLGFSPAESFGYSVLMSTFFWEYGFEAFAERPSIQDLIVTPVIGSLMGEMFFHLSEQIRANNGKALNSKRLGSVLLFFLNPATEISRHINNMMGSRVIQNSQTEFIMGRKHNGWGMNPDSNYLGVRIKFQFY